MGLILFFVMSLSSLSGISLVMHLGHDVIFGLCPGLCLFQIQFFIVFCLDNGLVSSWSCFCLGFSHCLDLNIRNMFSMDGWPLGRYSDFEYSGMSRLRLSRSIDIPMNT